MTIMINVGRDFARLPIGRYRRDSKTSGEAFREDVLVPALNRAADEVVVVDLSEALGYGSSFLDEAFGGLVRDRGYRREDLRRRLRIPAAAAILAEEEIGRASCRERVCQ